MHSRFKKIYIRVPANATAGGVEALFQLVDAINNISDNCYILYDDPSVTTVVPKYQRYNSKITSIVEDVNENLIIYPELWTNHIHEFRNIQKSIWWLSVDNDQGRFKEFFNENIQHFYQSYYAMEHLIKNGANRYIPIFEYISERHLTHSYTIEQKQNIVCFNPFKGLQITNIIISQNPHIKFVPLINMDESQVIETLKSSKVYIDFGNHPGRDRIPREAAHLGNCVITNTSGSAFYFNDVPILSKYKVKTVEEASFMINHCLQFYEENAQNFSLYRTIIKNQRDEMINQVNQFFT